MPDVEKVIKGLECCNESNIAEVCNCPYQPSHKSDMCLFELHADALALLKVQEPVEPIQDMVGDALFWVCGRCGHDISSSDWYCANCGRAVKWE